MAPWKTVHNPELPDGIYSEMKRDDADDPFEKEHIVHQWRYDGGKVIEERSKPPWWDKE